ncbi:MAG: AmmeMemoRadiSam system radical SAM enzyme [Thermosulfidibacteraceae bacterium]|jgi:pyruvate formate lyase activating enzyme
MTETKPIAKYWEEADNGKVICKLCPRECIIAPGKYGVCGIRRNVNGKLYASYYGEVVSIAIDPMEKKPLYHFYPSSQIISLATCGCNLKCKHCQNWTISQVKCETKYINPKTLVELALKYKSGGICFTYTEPMIWFEYIIDVAKIAKNHNLPIVLVTNGEINEEPLEDLLDYVDAMNIDLKSIRESFYREICEGKLEPVLHTIKRSYERGVHIEITNLVIPTLNDEPKDIEELVDFVASVNPEIPLHITRFFPNYRLTHLPPTPIETLIKAMEIAKRKLNFVYVGNVVSKELNSTYCPECGTLLIERDYLYNVRVYLEKNRCYKCKRIIPGIF